MYNQIFQREIQKGKSEIEAAEIARVEYAKYQRQQIKNRNVNGAKVIGGFAI